MKWLFPECRKTVPKQICSLTASDIFTRCNLVFTQDAAGNLSLDCALTAGGRIVAAVGAEVDPAVLLPEGVGEHPSAAGGEYALDPPPGLSIHFVFQ